MKNLTLLLILVFMVSGCLPEYTGEHSYVRFNSLEERKDFFDISTKMKIEVRNFILHKVKAIKNSDRYVAQYKSNGSKYLFLFKDIKVKFKPYKNNANRGVCIDAEVVFFDEYRQFQQKGLRIDEIGEASGIACDVTICKSEAKITEDFKDFERMSYSTNISLTKLYPFLIRY